MTGARIAEIMRDPEMTAFLFKCARRWSKNIEDQEEYVQEGYLRISRSCEDDTPVAIIHEIGNKAIFNAYRKRWRSDSKKRQAKGISIYKDSRKTVDLGRGRYLLRKYEILDPWYYHEEPDELGLDSWDFVAFCYYQILIER